MSSIAFYHFIKEVEKATDHKFGDWDKDPWVEELRRIEAWERHHFLNGLKLYGLSELLPNYFTMRMVALNTEVTIPEMLQHSYELAGILRTEIWANDLLNYECIFQLPRNGS